MLRRLVTYCLLFCSFFSSPQAIYSQDPVKIDSLENVLKSKKKKDRFEVLTALSVEIARLDYVQSQELADEAISLAKKRRDIKLEVSGYINKGYCHELNYEDSIAATLFRKALEISNEKNYNDGKAEALYRIGRSLSYQRDYSASAEYLDKSLELARNSGNFKIEGQVLSSLADNMRQAGNIDEAMAFYQKSLESARKADDINTLGNVYSTIGSLYYSRGDYHQAIRNYEESRKFRIQMGSRLRTAQTENNIANSYYNLARYDMAIEYYQKALPLFEELKYSVGIASVYNGMAVIYFDQKLYDKSLEYHSRKLEISEETGNLKEVGNTLNNIGNVYEKMTYDSISEILGSDYESIVIREKTDIYLKAYSKALDYYNQSLEIRNKVNDRPGLLSTLGNIGVLYLHSGKLDIAMKYLDKARILSQEMNNTAELALSLMRIGQVYNYKGQNDMTIRYMNQSLQYAAQSDLKAVMEDIYMTLSDIFEKKNDYYQALTYYKLFSNMKDSISREESVKMMTEMQLKFETESILKANELLVVQSQLSETRVRQQKFIIYFFIIILGLISGLVLFLVIRNYRKRQELNRNESGNLNSSLLLKKISLKLTRLFHWII